MPVPPGYDQNVFINRPFDDAYQPLFRALVFTVYAAGGKPRCALEVSDTSEVRIRRILRIIGECRFGIHDLSRTEVGANGLPRFNMPLELGIFLGCKEFGAKNVHQRKSCLVLDRERYRYQQFISDIAGQDPEVHHNDPLELIRRVRDWLRTETRDPAIQGADYYVGRYQALQADLPEICAASRLSPDTLQFPDLTHLITTWLHANP
jgi:hypothetical protein